MSFDFSNFGKMVFGNEAMQKFLSKDVYAKLRKSIDEGNSLDPSIADSVAEGMKNWAIELGATHYTHWFQPLTSFTAGKHDSFIHSATDSHAVLKFSGKELIKGEPDASSFPSGGLRNTFEARGYTAWDCTSPAFVRDRTLYIPTAFCSYTGEALDMKTPLIRSMTAINDAALRFVKLFGDTNAKRVLATVGAEQEYFLIDREKYEQRLDLKICGRTLFGANPPKGQEMDDHYFGRIRLRVSEFMAELDKELWLLGVPCKTEHNEAAPAQHELAPIFDTVNVACDHNQLTMELMRIVAKKKGLACLLHEKPFANVNGSGKHNNWSISTNDGQNLLDPGKTPYQNMRFLVMLCAVITAVDKHADLLRMSASVPGNDHRLGGAEAPPAIISIFLGEQLTELLNRIATGGKLDENHAEKIFEEIPSLPTLIKDDCDRNRTSPFAFTGNKFEFRSVGSSASLATANYVLDTIVAESLDEICDRLCNAKDFDKETINIIKDTMENHGRVIYNGNNYTDEWVKIAKKRGLPNLTNCVDAASALIQKQNIDLMEKYHVLTETECYARYEIKLENYSKIITIEANTMLEMVHREILPSVIRYTGKVAKSYNALKESGFDNASMQSLLSRLSNYINAISSSSNTLQNILSVSKEFSNIYENAVYCRDKIVPQMKKLRLDVDTTETEVSKDAWNMPSYTDLLHRV